MEIVAGTFKNVTAIGSIVKITYKGNTRENNDEQVKYLNMSKFNNCTINKNKQDISIYNDTLKAIVIRFGDIDTDQFNTYIAIFETAITFSTL